jgi:hypothetical protein
MACTGVTTHAVRKNHLPVFEENTTPTHLNLRIKASVFIGCCEPSPLAAAPTSKLRWILTAELIVKSSLQAPYKAVYTCVSSRARQLWSTAA